MQTPSQSWKIDSWQQYPIVQQPQYDDQQELEAALATLRFAPPLVFAGEIEKLRRRLKRVAHGQEFLLQGGDCAETFADCNGAAIRRKLMVLLQMSVVLCYGARRPILRVGRIAGQYAKPRSANTEVVDGVELPVYRGDSVNCLEPTLGGRRPDPGRLVQAHHCAAMTLNYIRSLTGGGFADLRHPERWDLKFAQQSTDLERYQGIISQIQAAITFMESLGSHESTLEHVEFYTSHEGLFLNYEQAQTEYVAAYDGYYDLSAHMLWIGDRTRQLDGAHMEFFRGIKNPIGVKVGPSSDPRQVVEMVQHLCEPHGGAASQPGKITLISRFGDGNVAPLEGIIKAVQDAGLAVVWSCDPMHGNAIKTEAGIKTRDFGAILSELRDTFAMHQRLGSRLGGVHFELTGEDVTECTGGSVGIKKDDLSQRYESHCDPRLNYSQSLEMAFLLADMLAEARK